MEASSSELLVEDSNENFETKLCENSDHSRCYKHVKPPTAGAKICISLSVMITVVVIVYFTPFPDLNAPEESCNRDCHELEWPRICRFKFLLELQNEPLGDRKNCTHMQECFVDPLLNSLKYAKMVLKENNEFSGNVIQVCKNDLILVDVANLIPGRSISIHWRGQSHWDSPHMDGATMVTQCPIPSYTTFQYKFRAADAGTHLWHLHTDDGDIDGVYGMMVVRESMRDEPLKPLYDNDTSDHLVIMRQSGRGRRFRLSVNGFSENHVVYPVQKGWRYRFRVAHAGGSYACPVRFAISRHKMLVAALDGKLVRPLYTETFVIASGERLDFILEAIQLEGKYEINLSTVDCDRNAHASAFLNYKTSENPPDFPEMDFKFVPEISTLYENCSKDVICLEDLRSPEPVPTDVKTTPDKIIRLIYHHSKIRHAHGNFESSSEASCFNNISFYYPPSPLISQLEAATEFLCNEHVKPNYCRNIDRACQCTHVIDIAKGSLVEIVLVDGTFNNKRHAFHLHGHKFYVLTRKKFEEMQEWQWTEERMEYERNLENPVVKDTIVAASKGITVIRFKADKSGFWMLREYGDSLAGGMEVVFKANDIPPKIPEDFPKCGNWIGPKYFLV